MRNEMKLYVQSSLNNLSFIRAMGKIYLEHQKIDTRYISQLLSILDELTTNAIEHGYEYELGDISIEMQRNENEITLVVEDYGLGFNEFKERKSEGGMGLFMARKMSDELEVEKKEIGTKIKITKVIEVVN